MTAFSHSILGGDYERAGSATAALKDLLKSIGVDAESTRRAIIAAYEAELNVVIHAHRGTLRANILDHRLDVEVADEGPGIADIAVAMQPGFSTAPESARSLGFGAGLGLPNIERHADAFCLESSPGIGCQLRFSVDFSTGEPLPVAPNSLRFVSELCRNCLRCVPACPSHALRVRGRGPTLLAHRCLDCNVCLAACAHGAIELAASSRPVAPSQCDVLVLPAAILSDFGPAASPERVLEALTNAGFERIELLEGWERSQQEALHALAAETKLPVPLIDVSCPVVVNLVETLFPSLIEHLPPLLSPVEAAQVHLKGQQALFVVTCPAQQTRLLATGVAADRILLPRTLRRMIDPVLAAGRPLSIHRPSTVCDSDARARSTLAASGVKGAIRVLEALETGRLEPLRVLELRACRDGCFGSPLLRTASALGLHRFREASVDPCAQWAPVFRDAPYRARSALRLDPDMQTSVRKLHRMAQALRSLPGADCARCGAPSCRAQAEDFALGRVRALQCQHPDSRRSS